MKTLCQVLILSMCLASCASQAAEEKPSTPCACSQFGKNEHIGTFSVSLTVKDLAKSRAFYEELGFKKHGGDQAQNWLIMQNGDATIGLFQGMFPKNMLTFCPGWNRDSETLEDFRDVRDLQAEFGKKGIKFTLKADEATSGPASLMIIDPDGNPILIDQHVPRPRPTAPAK